MTRLTTKLMIAAAALVAAGAASAQTMKADIPFAFRASGKVMAPGAYQVVLGATGNSVLIRRFKHEAVLAMPLTRAEGKSESAKLVFKCGSGTCALAEIWPGYSTGGLRFATPKVDRMERASLMVVPLRPATE